MTAYDWPRRAEFVNRVEDLARIEEWWNGPSRDALCIFGRRRVGKSWLFQAFAHGKPAVILIADRRLAGPQLQRFADQLEIPLGVRPEITDVIDLIRAAYRLGRDERCLVVIDELPYLLPEGATRPQVLTAIQRVMEEERDASHTKLLMCGSLIAQMETLLAQSSPLHGRLVPLEIRPMDFGEAQGFLDPSDNAEERIVRTAVAGGMARHLAELGRGPLDDALCRTTLNVRGSLFNDPRTVLEQELRAPATYFSILEALADGERGIDHLAEQTHLSSSALGPYLQTLERMRLISERLPVGVPRTARGRKYRIDDGFIRFWFRFVFPFQTALEGGLPGRALWEGRVSDELPDFVGQAFEDLCLRYTRRRFGTLAPTIGTWWGNALDTHRRAKTRMVEEIDVVGVSRKRLRIVGECRWTTKPMRAAVLDDLLELKVPALLQQGNLTGDVDDLTILLFCRSGFDAALTGRAAHDPRLELIGVEALVEGLTA
ncbi:MAG: ATP-binding protein [Thermoleophilia bacterium]|nr:ATP-binding protein [Thermoleophilia bacterium]